MRAPNAAINGILIIDKPAGMTSHDVVARVRRVLGTRQVGHTGTLDPFATGVMVILVGNTTRLAQYLDKDAKEYEALVRFGYGTDTGDRTGARSDASEISSAELRSILDETDWDTVLAAFRGELEQVPPMYSAKKIDGKKLYEHARKGITIERKAVTVYIHELGVVRDGDSVPEFVTLRVRCSAGTYIRTLAEDIGRKLGIGAHLNELRRTAAGIFKIDQAATLEQLAGLSDPAELLIAAADALPHLRSVVLTDERVTKTRNGLSTRFADVSFDNSELVKMLGADGSLVAVGTWESSENVVRPRVVLM